MPVKKTTTKKPIAKKVVTKTATKTAIVRPTVVVETKKTNNAKKSSFKGTEWIIKLSILLLLLLNLVFGILNLVKKDSVLKLEALKVGGTENLEKVVELYNSNSYKEQQTAAIQQFMMWE